MSLNNICPVCGTNNQFKHLSIVISGEAFSIIQCENCKQILYSEKDAMANAVNKASDMIAKMIKDNQDI